MAIARDYTAILYAADGQPDLAWNSGLSGAGTAVIVSYSFVQGADLAGWEAQASYANDGYTAMTTAQRANFRDALAIYSRAAGIVFVEVASGQGMINAMNTSGSAWGGWANTAYSQAHYTGRGELVIDNSGDYNEGTWAFQSILHELGHAMGLEHPWEGNITLDPGLDDQGHTVMTYNGASPYTSVLGSLDLAAMRVQYGAAAAVQGWVVTVVGAVVSVKGSARGDTIVGVAGQNSLDGGLGADRLYGRQAADTLQGGAGGDQLLGSSGADRLFGAGGNDSLFGDVRAWSSYDGADSLYGGAGHDRLTGGAFADRLYGGIGNDTLDSRDDSDTVYGGAGDDRIYGGDAPWCDGDQRLYGDGGADRLNGFDGSDSLYGGPGNDVLDGGRGWDALFGGDGNDVFRAGGTASSLERFTGGAGADVFVLKAADTGSQVYILDFVRGEDKIDARDLNLSFGDHDGSGNWFRIGNIWINTALAGQLTADDFRW